MIGFLGQFGWLLLSCVCGYAAQATWGGGVPLQLAVVVVMYLVGIFAWYGLIAR